MPRLDCPSVSAENPGKTFRFWTTVGIAFIQADRRLRMSLQDGCLNALKAVKLHV